MNVQSGHFRGWWVKPRFVAGLRFGLGMGQMFMAVFSMVLLIETGLSRLTLISAGFTTILTLTSRLMFHSKREKVIRTKN